MLTQRRWALALALTASAAACGDGSSVVGGPTPDATVSNDLGADTGLDTGPDVTAMGIFADLLRVAATLGADR